MHLSLRRTDGIRALLLIVLAGCAALSAGAANRAPALVMNLDEFDKAKKTVLLPNGITLGYQFAGCNLGG